MEIQKSKKLKLSKIFLKVLDFWILLKNPKIPNSKNPRDSPESFGFLDFSENCVFALCYTNFFLKSMTDNKKMQVLDPQISKLP